MRVNFCQSTGLIARDEQISKEKQADDSYVIPKVGFGGQCVCIGFIKPLLLVGNS